MARWRFYATYKSARLSACVVDGTRHQGIAGIQMAMLRYEHISVELMFGNRPALRIFN